MNQCCVEGSRLSVILDEGVWSLNLEQNALLRTYIGALVIEVHDTESICLWSVPVKLHKKGEHAFVLDDHLAVFYVAYVLYSGGERETFENIMLSTMFIVRILTERAS